MESVKASDKPIERKIENSVEARTQPTSLTPVSYGFESSSLKLTDAFIPAFKADTSLTKWSGHPSFHDDTVFAEHNLQDAQELITRFPKSAKAFGLKINLKKTDVMYQAPQGSHNIGQDKQIEGRVQTLLNKFKYIGTTVANDNKLDAWTSNTSEAFERLKKRVWLNKDPSIKSKCTVCTVL